MIAPDVETAVDRLGQLIDAAKIILPFTGAGISTECGIPDFRSPGGIWTKNQPIPFDSFMASREMRDESWRRRFAMEKHFAAARPGRADELPVVGLVSWDGTRHGDPERAGRVAVARRL